VGEDGQSLRETLEVVAQFRGQMPEEGVNPADFPDAMTDLWRWYAALSGARQPAMAGVAPISSSEMLCFFQLERIELEGWEPGAIRRIDVAYRQSQSVPAGKPAK
jgi:hypothetical protein